MRRISSLLAVLPCLATAQNDAEYTKKIKEYTTEPFFSTSLVDHVPASTKVPSPLKHFGHIIGTPNLLHYVDEIHGYMHALDNASDRVQVFSMGKSEEGREMIVVVISDAANLRLLDRYRRINAVLGDPREINPGMLSAWGNIAQIGGTRPPGPQTGRPPAYDENWMKQTERVADDLVKHGLPMYWLTAGMHSPEAGPPEMVMELAYRLAVEETPFIRNIRKNVITMITPVLDTDGRDRYVDTYMYRKKNPTKPPIPLVYWGKYVAHDNNRDGMATSLALSQNLMETWLDFKPQVMHDLHESVPFLYISTGTGPYNAWLDPITIDEWHQMAYEEVGQMTAWGVPGVWTHGFYDGWAPNYAFYAANGHNAVGRFYETQGGQGADTRIINVGNQTQREWFRPNPPLPRVRWSLRNNTNLMQTGVLLGLSNVANNKEKFLRNYYLKSKRSVLKARTEGPAAYVIPAGEPRRDQQARLLAMLERQGIEVHVLKEAADTTEGKFAAGSIVIRMDQPYSRMADMLLDKQYYRPDDPRPYDDTGWTLGPLFNVQTVRVKDSKILDVPMTTDRGVEAGNWKGALVIRQVADTGLARFAFGQGPVELGFAQADFEAEGHRFNKGDLIAYSEGTAPEWIDLEMGDIVSLKERPKVEVRKVAIPRIAMVHTWQSTQDEGWFRLAFDEARVPYKYVSVHELRDTPDLKSKYDVIVIAPTGGTAQSMVNGISKEGVPIPWKPMEGFKHLGGPDTSDNIRGGIELQGVMNLQRFLNDGGLLICAGNPCRIPIDYGLVSGVSIETSQTLFAPGGVYKVENAMRTSPVTAGYQDTFAAYFRTGPLLSVGGAGFGGGRQRTGRNTGRGDRDDPDVVQGRPPHTPTRVEGDSTETTPQQPQPPRPQVLVRFAPAADVLISGSIDNPEELGGRPAVVLCPVGKGNVLLFSINPMWRQQTHGSWMLVFNAAMNWNALR